MKDKNKEKTQIIYSKKGLRCIGPCYFSESNIIHPLTLEFNFPDKRKTPICAVSSETLNENSKKYDYFDECSHPTTKKQSISSLLCTPQINFDEKEFLDKYYNINSFDDAIKWMFSHPYLPLNTQSRIVNLALKVYGKEIVIIDSIIIIFMTRYLKTNCQTIYDNVKEKYSTSQEKYNYKDIKNMINTKFVNRFFKMYIKKFHKKWDLISDQLVSVVSNFSIYLAEKLKK